jgi:DNA-3-methyladenine glycosylase II
LCLLRVTEAGTPDSPALDVHLLAGEADPAQALTALGHVLPSEPDRAAFYDHARHDERLWRLVAPLVGLPDIRTPTLFESLMQVVIEQQIAWRAALRAQRWLVEWAGHALDYAGRVYYAFPTPEQIAAATVDDLKPLKITFKRMALLIDLAAQTASGQLDLESLRHAPPDEAFRILLSIKGIGEWTAGVALARAFGHPYVARGDVALQAATNRYFHGGAGRLTPDQLSATFARYGAFAGHAARYTIVRWLLDEY